MFGEWRSLVAHLLWEQRVAGSNPVSPTILAIGRTRTAMMARIVEVLESYFDSLSELFSFLSW
jgi:hypothetical protein